MSDLLLIHGLTYDHRAWTPLRKHLDPGRRVLAVDLPGHGSSPRRDAYPLTDLIAAVHEQVTAAGLIEPVVVGHSAGAIIAGAYAARYPAAAVVNIDQMLLPGPFFAVVRTAEPQLRGPRWREFWERMLAGMGIESLPDDARKLVETATDPRQDLLLGYWDEILRETDEQIRENRLRELRAIASKGIPYHWVNASEPPTAYLRWLRSVLPQAEVTVVPGGHFPHIADPAAVAAML
ncbi:alpha/beta fold hydrolase [Winogradskya consettensis]|nr:alpha/beta hydrolase [Actinoplanes consettensis]